MYSTTYHRAASVDEGVPLGLHGRANYLPARNVYHDGEWDGERLESHGN